MVWGHSPGPAQTRELIAQWLGHKGGQGEAEPGWEPGWCPLATPSSPAGPGSALVPGALLAPRGEERFHSQRRDRRRLSSGEGEPCQGRGEQTPLESCNCNTPGAKLVGGSPWVRQESGRALAAPGPAGVLGRMRLKPSCECPCYGTSSASVPGASDRRVSQRASCRPRLGRDPLTCS